MCVCVFFPFILDIKFVGCTSRGHTGESSHSISPCIRLDALLLLYIIINLFYYVLKMFLFCSCLVSLHDD